MVPAEAADAAVQSPSDEDVPRDVARAYRWSLAVSLAVPIVGAVALRHAYGDARWVNEPVHSTLETAGALVAILVATLLLLRRRTYAPEPHYAWVALALVCMGTLDLAHACTPQGPAFFWSRALPTLLGGAGMALVWLRPGGYTRRLGDVGLAVALAVAVVLGAALLAWPGAWPLMFSPRGYTAAAKLVNVAGGVGFLAASAFFVRRYGEVGSREDLVLANHCLLFGAAAVLFSLSHMWGPVWWLFHALRLAAYLVVLAYVFALYQRFEGQQGALEARLEFQQLMLGTVGHDMRTPISAIRLTVEALRRRGAAAAASERTGLDRIDRSAGRLEELVSTVLDFARARAGAGIPVERSPTALDDVVARVVDELAAATPGRTIRLQVSGDATGEWDGARLAQVAANLVQNAIRYGAPGGPVKVTVDGRREHDVVLSVHNDGEPIPPALLGTVFEPFQRGSGPGERGSVGLGLFIVREIARAHGGDVAVTSSAEAGTCFRVRLPRRPPAAA